MACATNASKVTQAAGKYGITPASNRIGYTLGGGHRKRIRVCTDMPFSESAPLTISAQDKQIPGYGINIAGPSKVVSTAGEDGQPVVWIETHSPLEMLPKTEFYQGLKSGKNGHLGTEITAPAEKAATPKKEEQEQSPVNRTAISKNARQFLQAIKQQRKVQVRYRLPKGRQRFTLVPLDIKPGRTANTQKRRYMWGYSESSRGVLCLRLDKVIEVKSLDATFDPDIVAKTWDGKKVKWNLPRKW